MKNNLTNEQIKELVTIAKTEEVGTVVNLAYFGQSAKLDTRLNRIERILPDVNSFAVLGEDGKFSPLSEQEKTDTVMKMVNDFWKAHLNYDGNRFTFNNLQDDFFTTETYDRLLSYAKQFFANRIDSETAGRNQYKYKLTTKSDIKMLEQMNRAFPKSLGRKMKEVSKNFLRRKREQNGKEISLLQQLIANNLAWQDAQTLNSDGAKHALNFGLN